MIFIALDSGRLLVVSPVSAARVSASTAAVRNRWILENCDSVYVGALDPAGRLARQISQSRKDMLLGTLRRNRPRHLCEASSQ